MIFLIKIILKNMKNSNNSIYNISDEIANDFPRFKHVIKRDNFTKRIYVKFERVQEYHPMTSKLMFNLVAEFYKFIIKFRSGTKKMKYPHAIINISLLVDQINDNNYIINYEKNLIEIDGMI